MAMNPKCVDAVQSAAASKGRARLTDAQIQAVDDRLRGKMKYLAYAEKDWQAMPLTWRVSLAVESVIDDIKAEAARKVENAERQVLATAQIEDRFNTAKEAMGLTRGEFWADEMAKAAEDATVIHKELAAEMMEAIDAIKSGEGASVLRRGLMMVLDAENPKMTADLVREIHAKGNAGTGNAMAISAAKNIIEVREKARLRFNRAGGDVGRLNYGQIPNAWEPELILRAGPEKFAAYMLDKVDRQRYRTEAGALLNDAQMLEHLRRAGETLGTNGSLDEAMLGRMKGKKPVANKGNEHREIHWKDGDSYLAAMKEFGAGTMYDAIMGDLRMMSRDIALIERFGPNPDAQHVLQKDLAAAASKRGKEPLVAWSALDHHWAEVAGMQVAQWEYTPPVIAPLIETLSRGKASGRFTGGGAARFWQHARNIEVYSKLQGTLIASLGDMPTYFATVHYNKLPVLDAIANIPKSLTPFMRAELADFMNTQGLIADTMIDSMNRFTGENVSAAWSGKLSQMTMRLGLVNWWTDGMRRAFSLTMQQGVAKWLAKDFGQLDEWTRNVLLKARGITEDDWQVMRSATLMKTKWGDILTPQAIYATDHPRAQEVAKRYLSLLSHESTMAIIEADVASKAVLRRGTVPGSAAGEAARIVAQFKAFPTAMFTKHWDRVLHTPAGLEGAPLGYQSEGMHNRLATLGALLVSMTGMGALVFQAQQLAAFKDPIDMTTSKFWIKATLRGGGLSHMGDVLLRDSTSDRSKTQGLFELLGPMAGTTAEVFNLTQGNLAEAAAGQETNAGEEWAKFALDRVPFTKIWYARTALNRSVLDSLQESMNPGYLDRASARAQRDWNQESWWPHGESLPTRAPDFSVIGGE